MATMTCPVCNEVKLCRANGLTCLDCATTPAGLRYRRLANQAKSAERKRGYTAERKAAGIPDPRSRKKPTYRMSIRCELCGREALVLRSIEHLCDECKSSDEGLRYMRELRMQMAVDLRSGARIAWLSGKPVVVGVLADAPEDIRDEYLLMRGRVLPDTMGWVDYEGYVFRQNNLTYASVGGGKVLL